MLFGHAVPTGLSGEHQIFIVALNEESRVSSIRRITRPNGTHNEKALAVN